MTHPFDCIVGMANDQQPKPKPQPAPKPIPNPPLTTLALNEEGGGKPRYTR